MLKLEQGEISVFVSYNGRSWDGALVVGGAIHEITLFIPSPSNEEPESFFHVICEFFGVESDPSEAVAVKVHERPGCILDELECIPNPLQKLEIFNKLVGPRNRYENGLLSFERIFQTY